MTSDHQETDLAHREPEVVGHNRPVSKRRDPGWGLAEARQRDRDGYWVGNALLSDALEAQGLQTVGKKMHESCGIVGLGEKEQLDGQETERGR